MEATGITFKISQPRAMHHLAKQNHVPLLDILISMSLYAIFQLIIIMDGNIETLQDKNPVSKFPWSFFQQIRYDMVHLIKNIAYYQQKIEE